MGTLFQETTRDEMCIAFLWVYPKPDWWSATDFQISPRATNMWLDDAYTEGLWDVDHNGLSIDDLLDDGTITRPSDIKPKEWNEYGGYWNTEHDSAATFYDKLWNDDKYSERTIGCERDDEDYSVKNTTFEDEFGELQEYCTDPCGYDETKTTSATDVPGTTMMEVDGTENMSMSLTPKPTDQSASNRVTIDVDEIIESTESTDDSQRELVITWKPMDILTFLQIIGVFVIVIILYFVIRAICSRARSSRKKGSNGEQTGYESVSDSEMQGP